MTDKDKAHRVARVTKGAHAVFSDLKSILKPGMVPCPSCGDQDDDRTGCLKCLGKGWVYSKKREKYESSKRYQRKARRDNSRQIRQAICRKRRPPDD